MQSHRFLLALAVTPLVLAACGGAKTAATTTPATTTTAAPSTLTIVVNSVSVTSVAHDRSPKGTSKGDRIMFTDTLLNNTPQFGKGASAAIGKDSGTLSFTSSRTARLTGTATLPNGTISFSGAVIANADGTLSVAVVGGTGKYARVTGSLKVGRGVKQALNTYTLTFPGALATGPVA